MISFKITGDSTRVYGVNTVLCREQGCILGTGPELQVKGYPAQKEGPQHIGPYLCCHNRRPLSTICIGEQQPDDLIKGF